MLYIKTHAVIPYLLSNYEWSYPNAKDELFLTFDDGPTPGITEYVLDTLDAVEAKATFFMVGANVAKYPTLAREVLKRGHSIGNHTYNHVNGWKTTPRNYWIEVSKTDDIIQQKLGFNPTLFRPPYGRINFFASDKILESHKIIMWDILARDFDPNLTSLDCINNVIDYAKSGSTIVLHDSIKCGEKIKKILPKILNHFSKQRYNFSSIPANRQIQTQSSGKSVSV